MVPLWSRVRAKVQRQIEQAPLTVMIWSNVAFIRHVYPIQNPHPMFPQILSGAMNTRAATSAQAGSARSTRAKRKFDPPQEAHEDITAPTVTVWLPRKKKRAHGSYNLVSVCLQRP